MARLEDLKRGALVTGVTPSGPVSVVDVKWHGANVIELTYKDSTGKLGNALVYRDQEPALEVIEAGKAWNFDSDGSLFRLVAEAYRIKLAYLFDPLLAVHTSVIEPLPHQITAVYETMLPRQPLRFLLADDPGAGKTIMAGLLIKELMIRGDVIRCLICCPGNLADQWQDELWQRFHLDFKIISNQTIEDSKSGNPYNEINLAISRLDHMSRNEDIQAKLLQTEWDMVIVDEAHKMSAHFFGNEIQETKRYKLGKLLGDPNRTRHLLLMTATPHSGKEEDFQLFMALLDNDRFEGKFRDGVHVANVSDIMRRMVKEQMIKFDGTRLFPERWAYTVNYKLSDNEAALYSRVTDYVREEMNRADRLAAEGEGRRGNRVGFALTTLQRRLASSPKAIYESLRRRRDRLERRLSEVQLLKRGTEVFITDEAGMPDIDKEYIEDLDERPDAEVEKTEDQIVEQASAARTIVELQAEITTLKSLEELAHRVLQIGTDKKWDELSNLLQDTPEMFDEKKMMHKLIIFSEHRDTVNYLADKIRSLIGRQEAVVIIHGGLGREERRNIQEAFIQDKTVKVLVATDAAGEGINLQRAHLMINYDLPWNPNRLEQRFGRIHRIGQTEVCHMWNLVASETREGDVFRLLLEKLERERSALGGGVFDVLGRIFEGDQLRKLLIEAIRYGEKPEVRERYRMIISAELDSEHLKQLLDERALAHDSIDASRLMQIKEDMERAEARRLQPHFIRSFFMEAFHSLGGTVREREPKRYEITHVPAILRHRDRQIGLGEPLLSSYERICFEKEQITLEGKPLAAFVCPGHPLLDVAIDVILERHRELLKKGTILVDEGDDSEDMRSLFFLEHSLQDATINKDGRQRVISRQLQFVEIDTSGNVKNAGYAPYLDYRPVTEDERKSLQSLLETKWLQQDLEPAVLTYAIEKIVPMHLVDVRKRKEDLISRTMQAVKDRLTREINYWDHRTNELKAQELAGKTNARINSGKARQRADELEVRLKRRQQELELERHISPSPPMIIGGAVVIPAGLLARLSGERTAKPDVVSHETVRIEKLAMAKVFETEKRCKRIPVDVSANNCGYDIESKMPDDGKLYFIEVKGRVSGATTVTITKNEILTGFNKPDDFILAIVMINGDEVDEPIYVRQPFSCEPDFGVTSVNYNLIELAARGEKPK